MEDKSASVTVSGAGEPFLPTWQQNLAWSYLGTTVWGTQHLPLHNPSQRDPEGILVSPGMRSGSSPVHFRSQRHPWLSVPLQKPLANAKAKRKGRMLSLG